MREICRKLAICLLGVFLSAQGAPIGPFYVDAWKTGPGQLPQSSVIAMTQTHDGYLWLGTVNGLVRFDGSQFAVFDESVTPRLGAGPIVRLFEDRERDLWIGTAAAGAMLVKDGRIKKLDLGGGGLQGRVLSICEDSVGAVWILTQNEVGRYWKGEVNVWNMPVNARCMAAEANGRLWIGSDARISGYEPEKVSGHDLGDELALSERGDCLLASKDGGVWQLGIDDGGQSHIQKWRAGRIQDFGPYPWAADRNMPNNIRAACEDLEGNLIVGLLDQGIYWFDAEGHWTHLSNTNGLSINSVLSMQMDREGNLWVGLDGGGSSREGGPLNCVRRPALRVIEGSGAQVIESAAEDSSGAVWFSSRGRGVDRVGPAGGMTNVGSASGPLSIFNAGPILIDSNKTVWAGTLGAGLFRLENGVFRFPDGFDSYSRWIYSLHQDRHGILWVGSQSALSSWDGRKWKTFTTADGLPNASIRAIADDAQGNLWLGTDRAGLVCLRDGRFTSYSRTNGFPTDSISSLCVDSSDALWIGAVGNGLVRMDKGAWMHYTRREGLVSDIIDYVIDDDLGSLWAGTDWGLMRIPKGAFVNTTNELMASIPCRLFDQRDGLPNIDCTVRSQPAAFRAADGKLLLPTIGGLVSVDPSRLELRTNAPPVVIESVVVQGQNQDTNDLPTVPPQSVTVPVGKQQLEITYASLQIGAADRAQFRYILENHPGGWTEAHGSRFVRYPGLPPGNYRFRVIASSEDGVWDESQTGATLDITVLPHFWQRLWFRAVAVVCLVAMVSGIVFFVSTQRLQRQVANLRQQQALEDERARIARDIHDQVGASLTQISLLGEMVESDKDDPGEVEAHGRQLSQTARETAHALDEIVWTVNPRNDTLEGLVNYICKQAQDYLSVAGVRYRLDIPPSLPATPISPEARHNVFLAAKEAVTNVVRHAKATEASVRLRLEPPGFVLEVEDNGKGLAGLDPNTTRNGLRNMRKRMEDIGGAFDLSSGADGRGAVVRLTVPLNHAT